MVNDAFIFVKYVSFCNLEKQKDFCCCVYQLVL